MDRHSFPSIEKFAAFLDGNLPQDEMQQLFLLSKQNEMLHQLIDASSVIDKTISGFTESDLQLPPEIGGTSFEIPTIPSAEIASFVPLTLSQTDDIMIAAACATEDIHPLSDNPSIDNFDNPTELTAPTNLASDSDGNGADDFAGTSPDVI